MVLSVGTKIISTTKKKNCEEEANVPAFHMFSSPYSVTLIKKFSADCDVDNYGLHISTNCDNNCAFVTDIKPSSSALTTAFEGGNENSTEMNTSLCY